MRFAPVLVVALVALPTPLASAAPDGQRRDEADVLEVLDTFTGGRMEVGSHGVDGAVTFVGGTAALTPVDGRDAAVIARSFVDRVAPAFGVDGRTSRLVERRVRPLDDGGAAVRFDQEHRGVRVLGGQIVVRVDGAGRVRSSTGEALPDPSIDVTPSVTVDDAQDIALTSVARTAGESAGVLAADGGELFVFDPELLGVWGQDETRLVWSVDVRDDRMAVDRSVLVDAHDGTVVLAWSNLHAADSQVCDNVNVLRTSADQAECGPDLTVLRSDTIGSPGSGDVEDAYVLSRATLDYYAELGRDGIDGLGSTARSTVRFCIGSCPYSNAFWNSELQHMFYGAGYASADDVVAHEITHGVTEAESGLLYFGQSGAINESISDVFGELLDQAFDPPSGAGNDTGDDRWELGEDIPGFPNGIRDMADPPNSDDSVPSADRMGSEFYLSGPFDLYGVHFNSGVSNKAAYLLTDGDTFNGITVPAIGADKTARVYYEAQISLLTPGSDYRDLFVALPQACQNLVGQHGISAGDCAAVVAAVTATEMNEVPATLEAALTADDCPAGQVKVGNVFVDDFETSDGRWTFGSTTATNFGYSTDFSQSGTRSLHGPNPSGISVHAARTTSPIQIPAGATYLTFDHQHWFDSDINESGVPYRYWDGGVVEYSTSGAGGPFADISTLPSGGSPVHGYPQQLQLSGSDNPFAGRSAFAGLTPGFTTTRYDVSSLAGQSVHVRFRIGTDSILAAPGWWIDDVSVHRCAAPSTPGAPVAPTAAAGDRSVTLGWSAPSPGTSPITGYVVRPFVGGVAQPPIETGSSATSFTVAGLTNGTSYRFTVAARNAVGLGAASAQSAAVTPLGDLVAVTPKRVFDTRPGESPDALRAVPKTPVAPESPLQVGFAGLPGGLTPPTGIAAVSINVAVTNPADAGFITVFPCADRKLVASVNFSAGQTVSNAVIAPVSPDGDVCFFSSTPADLIVDLNSWFPATSGYTAVGPDRVFDTRPGESPAARRAVPKVQVTPDTPLEVQITGLPGGLTPGSGVGAVSMNVAVTNPADAGFITVFPCANRRLVASVNFVAGQTVSNAVIAPVSPSGRICFFSSAPTDLIVDINGWFPTESGYTAVGPDRVFDTRPGESPAALRTVPKARLTPAASLRVRVTDLGGLVPASGVGAVSLNVAVTNPELAGFITVYPCGSRELIASVNYVAGQTVSNAVIAPVSPDGEVCFFSSVPTDLIVDINGWFAD